MEATYILGLLNVTVIVHLAIGSSRSMKTFVMVIPLIKIGTAKSVLTLF